MELAITSVKNPRIRDAIRLRDRKGRDRQQRMIVDGYRECVRALQAGVSDGELFDCEAHLHDDQRAVVRRTIEGRQVKQVHVSDDVFRKLAFGKRTEGLILVAAQPSTSLDSLQLGQNPLVAVLEQVEKPGNLGAIIRTADAADISAVIVADGRTDLYNPNAIRASLGAIFRIPLAAGTVDQTIQWLRRNQIKIFTARVDGAINYTTVDFRQPSAIILGNESDGLTDAWQDNDMQAVTIPMHGVVDSLNVSATAAVLFYEALRQRREL